MFFRKYKILGSSLIVAACISISFPSQASMTPMQNNYTLKGLSQHQQRETSAVIALKTDNDDNTFISAIYNDMDTNTYKDISCEDFCEFLGLELIS